MLSFNEENKNDCFYIDIENRPYLKSLNKFTLT